MDDEPTKASFLLWRRLNRARKEECEKERLRVCSELHNALEVLSSKYARDERYLFGSLVKPDHFRFGSDVDIAVRSLSKFDHFAFVGDLSVLLNRAVDVASMEDCPFEEMILAKGVKWQSLAPVLSGRNKKEPANE